MPADTPAAGQPGGIAHPARPASAPVRDTAAMIAGMAPRRRPGLYVFAAWGDGPLPPDMIASFAEDEGLSVILPLDTARTHGLDCRLPMACIALTVASALDGVGLTAAVAQALADRGIPCNMVAALHHDHVFVPDGRADEAMDVLTARAAQG